MFIFLVHISQVSWGVWGSEQKFGCKSVDDNWDGLNVHSVLQVGCGSASGIIINNLETF
jgi:hypothetical protein